MTDKLFQTDKQAAQDEALRELARLTGTVYVMLEDETPIRLVFDKSQILPLHNGEVVIVTLQRAHKRDGQELFSRVVSVTPEPSYT